MSNEAFNHRTKKPGIPLYYTTIQTERCTQISGVTCSNTGPACYNTWESCPVKCDYNCANDETTHTNCPTSKFIQYIPDICRPPKHTSGRVDLCDGMARAGSVTVTYQDFINKDVIEDPYVDTREQVTGTSWEKFLQRNILDERLFTVGHGYCDSEPDEFIQRNYYIDTPDGPSKDCKYSVKAKDALSLLNDDSAKWPRETTNELARPLNPRDGVISVYSYGGMKQSALAVCIESEAIKVVYSGSETIGDREVWNYAIEERGKCGSTRNTDVISVGTKVQQAAYWPEKTHLGQVYLDLMHQDGEGLPFETVDCDCGPFIDAVVDTTQFQSIMLDSCYRHMIIDETIICKPTGIRALNKELSSFLTFPYLHDCTQKIKLHVYEPPKCNETLPVFTEKMMIDCEISVKTRREKRVSDIVLRTHQIDCTQGLEDDNLDFVYSTLNGSGLGNACNNPSYRGSQQKEIKNRFIGKCNKYLAAQSVNRLFYVLKNAPREVVFRIWPSQMPVNFSKTNKLEVQHSKLQNMHGQASEDVFWCNNIEIETDSKTGGVCYKITATTSGFKTNETWADSMTCEGDCPVQYCDESEGCTEQEGNMIW